MKIRCDMQSVRFLEECEIKSVSGGRSSTTTIGETFSGGQNPVHVNLSEPAQTRIGETTGGSMTAFET